MEHILTMANLKLKPSPLTPALQHMSNQADMAKNVLQIVPTGRMRVE